VAKNVADAGDVGPRHVGKAGSLVIRNMPAGLGHDLDAALDRSPRTHVGLIGRKIEARNDLGDLVDDLEK